MSSGRAQKRARQKERRMARREAFMTSVRRRRRQRLMVLAGSLLVVGVGLALVWFARDTSTDRPASRSSEQASGVPVPTPKPVACGGELPPTAASRKKSYSAPKDQNLDADRRYILRLETSCGDIDIELDVSESPKTANSVAFMAREHLYDGTFFHRIVPNFVIQGGDPAGDGTGGGGYNVVEPPPDDTKYEEGVVAMAKGQNDPPGTSQSQFFVVSGPEAKDLPAEYAVLGKVVEGMSVVEKIDALGAPTGGPPKAWAYIERATVVIEAG